MSEQKFTPGPWKVDEAEGLPIAVIENNEDGNGICEVGISTDPETVANARLIAAAPEMYELLKYMLEMDFIPKETIRILLTKIEGA